MIEWCRNNLYHGGHYEPNWSAIWPTFYFKDEKPVVIYLQGNLQNPNFKTVSDKKSMTFTLNDFKTSEIAQEKNHSVYIEAFIPNDDNLITPGLFVNVDVIFSDDQQVIKLPNSAIFFEDHYFCYVVENDIAKKVAVEINDSDNTNISVISPIIKSGDQVVVSGKKGLYDGAKVLIDNILVVSP